MSEKHYRTITIENIRADDERRIVKATLSSELPTPRISGKEILVHTAEAVDLSRAEHGLPVLFGHNPEKPIGVAENVRIDKRKLKADLRFGQSTNATEVWKDIKSGILKKVSIGYLINKVEAQDDDSYLVKSWTLFEVSIVGVPADDSVGIGRNMITGDNEMKVKPNEPDSNKDIPIKTERERVLEISALINMHKSHMRDPEGLERHLIESGATLDQARAEILNRVSNTSLANPVSQIGLGPRDQEKYSVVRALRGQVLNDWRGCEFEREISDELCKKLNRRANGIFVPLDALQIRAPMTTADQSELIASEHLAARFIDILRNRAQVMNLGATVLSDLTGNVEIPRASGAATAYWVAEDEAITESNPEYGQILLSPKTVGSLTQYTRKMLLQSSPDIENLVRNDLVNVVALAIDLAAINGTGSSNQPKGILNTTGVGSVAIGTNGGAPTYTHMTQLETEVAASNADIGTLAYLTNSSVRGKLRVTEKATNTGLFVWEDSPNPNTQGEGRLCGYRAAVSNQVPSNLTKGSGTNLSAVIFGNWADLIIAQWGVLELVVNPFDSTGFPKGNVFVRAMQDVDISVRHPESFAVVSDAVTT